MRRNAQTRWLAQRACITTIVVLAALLALPAGAADSLPWRQNGLSERQAAVHLLDRFGYGPRPGDVDRLLEIGLETWLDAQLDGRLADEELDRRLAELETWSMDAGEIAGVFPAPPVLARMAEQAGAISRERLGTPGDPETKERDAERLALMKFAEKSGYRSQRELTGDLMAQKVWRAAFSERQLEAVLADFWFNHFNVSTTDFQARVYVLSYERDAILPGVLGNFGDLLVETAMHPAMLLYLDNAQSGADVGARTYVNTRQPYSPRGGFGGRPDMQRPAQARGSRGLNENYARELLELHTLGVDGGYSQEDVVAVARAFTGWSLVPRGPESARFEERLDRIRRHGAQRGFFLRGEFLFRADVHDADAKVVLGRKLKPGRGYEDGLEVIEILAAQPSTARHVTRKLAVKFVSDEPPQPLLERLEEVFLESKGDIAATLRVLAYSEEFWSSEARGAKIKSPFELAVSALRALDASIRHVYPTVRWIERMGQPLYAYQAPTGFPDRAEAWVNTGALLNRMNFGIHLASGRVPGVDFDLEALNANREPESLEAALVVYSGLLMPERATDETVRVLGPVVRSPHFAEGLEEATAERVTAPLLREARGMGLPPPSREERRRIMEERLAAAGPPSPLANVVGVILGSPEFQRR